MEKNTKTKEDILLEEIIHILNRNKNERYLSHLIHCALAYEKAL